LSEKKLKPKQAPLKGSGFSLPFSDVSLQLKKNFIFQECFHVFSGMIQFVYLKLFLFFSSEINYPYKCPVCSKGFSVSIALNRHLRKHENVPDSKQACNDKNVSASNQVSTEKNDLNVENIDDYVGVSCPTCDELFRRKDLDEHQKTCMQDSSGDELPDPTESSGSFGCQSCNFRFHSARELHIHVGLNHDRQKLIETLSLENGLKCRMCKEDFKHQDSLIYHLVTIHKVFPATKVTKTTKK
jgi:DNA-directed RNA polymerase subunit RPC12/RpoP